MAICSWMCIMKVSDMVTAESPFGHMAMALLDLAENIGWGTT